MISIRKIDLLFCEIWMNIKSYSFKFRKKIDTCWSLKLKVRTWFQLRKSIYFFAKFGWISTFCEIWMNVKWYSSQFRKKLNTHHWIISLFLIHLLVVCRNVNCRINSSPVCLNSASVTLSVSKVKCEIRRSILVKEAHPERLSIKLGNEVQYDFWSPREKPLYESALVETLVICIFTSMTDVLLHTFLTPEGIFFLRVYPYNAHMSCLCVRHWIHGGLPWVSY